jgi:hypothetical protein
MDIERNRLPTDKQLSLRQATNDIYEAVNDAFSPMGWTLGVDYKWNELVSLYTVHSTRMRLLQGVFVNARQELGIKQQRALIKLRELGRQYFPNCEHNALLAILLIAHAGTTADSEKLSKSAPEVLATLMIDESGNVIGTSKRKADSKYVIEKLLTGELLPTPE